VPARARNYGPLGWGRLDAPPRPSREFGFNGQNYLYGPGVNNWDFAIFKRVPLGSEQRYIQFRTELFNAWNHTPFSGLDSTLRFDPQGVNQNPNVGA